MRILVHMACILLVLGVSSCGKSGMYDQKLKTLDSLSGAVSAVVTQFEKMDTIALQRSITRFAWYRQFIEQNIQDTINKAEADQLQQFYISGRNLEHFSQNRKQILLRGTLITSQLTKLGEDVKNRTLGLEQLSVFSQLEKTEAAKFVELGYNQQKLFHTSLEEFKNSLSSVESLIRSRNKGELPTIIKDTVNL